MRRCTVGFALFVAFLLAGCHAGQVRVPVSDAPNSPLLWRDKLDCNVFAKRTRVLRLSFDAALLTARVGPAVEFGRSVEGKWNDNVETVNTMYRALCNDWNAGLLSMERLHRKRDHIDKLYELLAREKATFQDAFQEYWKKQSDLVFAELDKELKVKEAREVKELQAVVGGKLNAVNTSFQAELSRGPE